MEMIFSAIAIIISVISGGFSLYTFIWTAKKDRKQATLDAYNQLQQQVFDELNLYRPSEIAEIAKNPRSPDFKVIGSYVARIEHFCVGVNQKIYDSKIVYELAHGYFDGSVKARISPVIEKKNCKGTDYYENIHKVYDWMEKETERRERNRK